MCFFRRKSKRVAAAKSVAAPATATMVPDSSAVESASTAGEPKAQTDEVTAAVAERSSAVAVLTEESEPGAGAGPGGSAADGSGSGQDETPDGAESSAAAAERDDRSVPAARANAPGGDAVADEPVDEPGSSVGAELDLDGELDREPDAAADAADTAAAADAAAAGADAGAEPEPAADADAVAEAEVADPAPGESVPAEQPEEVPSSEDMALPPPEIVDDGPRDQVWGQDDPEIEGKNLAALNQLIESVTMSTSGDGEPTSTAMGATVPTGAADAPEPTEDSTGEAGGTGFEDDDPDQMGELPSDRPVPADAIRRASEALDAAVNAAPAVIGPGSRVIEDEAVALVDAELTHFDRETEPEAEPDATASDYSVRVTDPIPVQSLSAPGVSRETSGPVQMPHGTQQPTGGPHGGDDERRSALIATVPAVDDTTPVAAELAMDARRRIELQGRRFPRPPKTRIITVANQKGGVGKTTTTVNVAAGLAQSGLNVLVIDNDPQGNASTALGIEHRAGTPSVYEVLVEGESLASTVQACPDVPNLWGVPATIDLSGSEIELVSLVSRETRLRKAIDKYLADRVAAGEERIDYVLIDCPPSLGLLTVNAFVAGREVFIPIQCEYYALEGLSQLLKTIDLIRSHLNPELRVSSILLTMYDGRTNLAQQVAGEVRSHFPAETFKTTIPRSVRISEAPSYGQTVMTYDATSTGALAYLQASRELAERGQGGSSPRRAIQAEPVGAQD